MAQGLKRVVVLLMLVGSTGCAGLLASDQREAAYYRSVADSMRMETYQEQQLAMLQQIAAQQAWAAQQATAARAAAPMVIVPQAPVL